jgi:uncharacterized membrane protein YbhN (UPF0104 family)
VRVRRTETGERHDAEVTPRLRIIASIAAPLVLLAIALTEWRTALAAVGVIRSARPVWILAAGVCVVGLFLAGSACQQGAVLRRLPLRRLLAVQLAAAVGNAGLGHVGGGYINVRFLRKLGLSRPQAIGAVSLNSAANASAHLMMLPLLLVVLPDGTLPLSLPVPSPTARTVLVAAITVATAIAWLARHWLGPKVSAGGRLLVRGCRDLLAVWRDPVRASQLWLGAISTVCLHGAVLYCMVHAIGLPLSLGCAMLVYLAASSASAFIPSPGGLGALDVSLALVLARAGATTPALIAAIAGYRLLTAWLPLVPATVTLGVLVRREVI